MGVGGMGGGPVGGVSLFWDFYMWGVFGWYGISDFPEFQVCGEQSSGRVVGGTSKRVFSLFCI